MGKNKIYFFIILVALLSVSAFFRIWRINSLPPGLYPDEAMNGVNALEAIDTGNYKVFYPENNGREGLFINIQALSIKLLGNTPLALRIISVIFGILTIPGIFLLAWFLFKKGGAGNNKLALRIAFISSLFMALSFWHLNFSRIGFRAITMPFFIVYSLLFLIIGITFWQKNKLSIASFITSGVLLGLGLYGYTPFRLVPFLFLGAALFFRKLLPSKILLKRFALLVIFSIIVFLPLGFYFLKNPADFSSRNNKIYFFQQEKPLKELSLTILKYAGMFNIRGDCNSRHNYPCSPQLNFFAGILFLVGFIGLWFKKIREKFSNQFWTIIPLGFFITLLPAVLTTEGAPHALRSIGAIPFVFIYTGLGVEIIYRSLKNRFFIILFWILVAVALLLEPYRYFVQWPKTNPDFSQKYLEESYFLKAFPGFQKIVVANASTGVKTEGLPTTVMTSKYILWQEIRDNEVSYIFPDELAKTSINAPFVLVSLEPNSSVLEQIKSRFPEGEIIEQDNQFQVFMVK